MKSVKQNNIYHQYDNTDIQQQLMIAVKQDWLAKQGQIAQTFSAAANKYHRHNKLQQRTANILLRNIQYSARLLDIGAGPGTDFFSNQLDSNTDIIALDLAMGMLETLRHDFPDYHRICADASQLPLQSNTIDTVYSNLALQWCPCLQTALNEVYRVLTPAGHCHLSIVVDGSLSELNQLDLQKNNFLTENRLNHICQSLNWQQLQLQIIPITLYFDDLHSLLYSVKGIGASTSLQSNSNKSDHNKGLKGRQYWQQLSEKMDCLRQPQGLPLTYNIAFIHGVK